MVKNAFTRAQNRTGHMSIADAVNVPQQTPEQDAAAQTRASEPERPAPVETVAQSTVEDKRPARDSHKLRRSTVQFDEESYYALKMASVEYNAPIWAITSEAVRAAVVEHRPFDWDKVYELVRAQSGR